MVADQTNTFCIYSRVTASTAGGNQRQPSAGGPIFRKRSHGEKLPQTGKLQFAPADRRKIAGDHSQGCAPAAQLVEAVKHARTNALPEIQHAAAVVCRLTCQNHAAHHRTYGAFAYARSTQHHTDQITIQHAGSGYTIKSGVYSR